MKIGLFFNKCMLKSVLNLPSFLFGVRKTKLFDKQWYMLTYPDVQCSKLPPLLHYYLHGLRDRRNPNPYFDASWYLTTYPDVELRKINPLQHYIKYGASEGRRPNPYFDGKWYRESYLKGDEKESPLAHYIFQGIKDGNNPSLFFDIQWYKSLLENTKAAQVEPLLHYMLTGHKEGFSPSPYFDAQWYLERYPEVQKCDIDPFLHFIDCGEKEHRNPGPYFDSQWYKNKYKDDIEENVSPFKHYVLEGYSQLRAPNKFFDVHYYKKQYSQLNTINTDWFKHYLLFGIKNSTDPNVNFSTHWYCSQYSHELSLAKWHPLKHYIIYGQFENRKTFPQYCTPRFDPLVSIIAINLNGEEFLVDFFETILLQEYKKYEIIIVDNGSVDDSLNIIEKYRRSFNRLIIVKNSYGASFAESINLGQESSSGEYISLLSIESRVNPDWLSFMVEALNNNRRAAGICPKIVFSDKFIDLTICSQREFAIKADRLSSSLNYKKYFVKKGLLQDGRLCSDGKVITLRLPVGETITLQQATVNIKLSFFVENNEIPPGCITENTHKEISIDLSGVFFRQQARPVIYNAGLTHNEKGHLFGRGYGEYDSNKYYAAKEVNCFCKESVLLRRAAFFERKLFVPELFSYYEDVELSRYLKKTGHSFLYEPKAVTCRRNLDVSQDNSEIQNFLKRRGCFIFMYNGTVEHLKITLEGHLQNYKGKIPQELWSIIQQYDVSLIDKLNTEKKLWEKAIVFAVYNRYWNSYGGGESHALSIANEIQKTHIVDLVGEQDFDLTKLERYYGLDLRGCRKLIIPEMNPYTTGKFRLFVNGTYMSTVPSNATTSWYIVYFPFNERNEKFLESYKFLFISKYTEFWSKKYWGRKIEGTCIQPLNMLKNKILRSGGREKNAKTKQKQILSVGRFFTGGHQKNQLIIARCYKKLVEKNPQLNTWKLILAGSLTESEKEFMDYYLSVKEELEGCNAEVLTNVDREKLDQLFRSSTLYVHASGLGQNKEKQPENFEHYGITIIEALLEECYPIVYEAGGPAETVQGLNVGRTYANENELVIALEEAILQASQNNTDWPLVKKKIIALYNKNLCAIHELVDSL